MKEIVMSNFGVTNHPRPTKVDELLGSQLMSSLNRLDIVARKIFSGKIQGEKRSRRRGISVEFADYRHYTTGDDLRFIDWNVYARLDKLFMKIFLEEEELNIGIAIDTSESMEFGNPNKFDFARRLAMSLGYIALSSHNRLSLFSFHDNKIKTLKGLRGKKRTRDMGEWLLQLQPSGSTELVEASKIISKAREGRGVLILLSDCMCQEGITQGIQYLVSGGWDVFVLQLLAPEELDPLAAGLEGDLKLQDIENGEICEVTVTGPLINQYHLNLESFCEEIRLQCSRLGVGNARVSTDVDIELLLIEYLRNRGLLR